jgi:hypothetical protein
MLPKFIDIEKGIAGRPLGDKKQRFAYYINKVEAEELIKKFINEERV